MNPFRKRLLRAQQDANFTVSDLSRWFDRARTTVHYWTTEDREPMVSSRDREFKLYLLESALAWDAIELPVPASIRRNDRSEYVRKIYVRAHKLFSRSDLTGRGASVRGRAWREGHDAAVLRDERAGSGIRQKSRRKGA